MGKFRIKHLVEKRNPSGKVYYYWKPSKTWKDRGYRLVPLGSDFASAMEQAEKINVQLSKEPQDEHIEIVHHSIGWWINEYKESAKFTKLAPRTQKDYTRFLDQLDGLLSNIHISSIDRRTCRKIYENKVVSIRKDKLKKVTEKLLSVGATEEEITLASQEIENNEQIGLTEAQGLMKVFRIVLGIAKDDDVIAANPAENMRIRSPKARNQVWTDAEMDLFMEKAIFLDRKSIGDALAMGRFLGQRVADIRNLTWQHYDGSGIDLQQAKTGAIVKVVCLPELKQILDGIERNAVQIIVSENTQKPYKKDNFEHRFADIRDTVIKDKHGHEIYPAIRKELQFKDLRRTAVVNLGRSGATTPEIASITGHGIETCQRILDVYFPKDPIAAANGIAKLHRYRNQNEGNQQHNPNEGYQR